MAIEFGNYRSDSGEEFFAKTVGGKVGIMRCAKIVEGLRLIVGLGSMSGARLSGYDIL